MIHMRFRRLSWRIGFSLALLGVLSVAMILSRPTAAARPAESGGSDHWAFTAPERPVPPAVEDESAVRNPIDRFVLARLEREGLAFAPEADRNTLVRRLYLDLIGLPPTPEQADAFIHDDRPDAYERLVDHLLASPHYGERWGRRWLDIARYSDTNGYEKDRPRSIWPYRDWVIDAFNDDMPFDQFTIEQIAGDMLADSTAAGAGPKLPRMEAGLRGTAEAREMERLSQRIATGFHRNTMINEEGGIDVEEFRYESVVDRVGTTATAWLGLTVACAQCHDHKYDPISQREYFRMFAFLNNADEPEMVVPDPAVAERREAIRAEVAAIEAELLSRASEFEEDFEAWRAATSAEASDWAVLEPGRIVSEKGATMTVLEDDSVLVSGDMPNNDTYIIELPTDREEVTALRLEALPHESLPEGGPGRAPLLSPGDFLLAEVNVEAGPGEGDDEPSPRAFSRATESYAQENRSAAATLDGVSDTGWSIQGRTGEPHHAVFEFAEPITGGEGGTKLTVTLIQPYIHQMTLGRFRISVTGDSRPVNAIKAPAEIEAILATPVEHHTEDQRRRLMRYYLLSEAEATAEQREKIAQLRKSMPEHPTTMVMRERLPEHSRGTHIHHRGEFLSAGDKVEPGVPAVLHPLPEDGPRNRLTFARWLIDESNPLVGRVVMNRMWQGHFGYGLVRTPGDFGTRGDPPTHPDLLDWLATEFPRTGWSMKAMHRLMVTSATYRQASDAGAESYERDPDNRLLARGPRLRVEAETVRDIALTIGGLLTRQVGGPSVFPPQPEGVTALSYGAMEWKADTGADRYRRGLYTFSKRTSPYAAFATFDAPSGERCIIRRERSNTPLQALTLMNDTVFVEAGRALARRAMTEASDAVEDRVAWMFRRCVTRPPDEAEVLAVAAFYREQLGRIAGGELDAASITGVEADRPPAGIDLHEWAAWTAVARTLLNLDETITRQ